MLNISYVVTAKDEINELKILLPKLIRFLSPSDELIIQLDEPHTVEVYSHCQQLTPPESNIKLITSPLNGDFAGFKNNFIRYCQKDYIFQIDADEVPHDTLLTVLKEILILNPQVDMIAVPRINVVPGITPEYADAMGWQLNNKGYINYPDYQQRIFRNNKKIFYKNKVHEVLYGYENYTTLPREEEQYCLLHLKSFERQKKQNQFYEQL